MVIILNLDGTISQGIYDAILFLFYVSDSVAIQILMVFGIYNSFIVKISKRESVW